MKSLCTFNSSKGKKRTIIGKRIKYVLENNFVTYLCYIDRYIYIYIHAMDILGKFRCLDIIQAYESTVTY